MIHKVVRIADTVLATDDDMALTLNRTRHRLATFQDHGHVT
jgi:hypothetical protein